MPDTPSRLIPAVRYTAMVAIALLCCYAIYCAYCCWWWPTTTTVIVVRHAEKLAVPPDDPPLSSAGEARAETLAHVLGEAGVTAVFATEYLRTQQTVEPTADDQGLVVLPYLAADAEGLANTIRSDHAGGVILVAGHSNTVSEILEELGGDPVGLIPESDYDNIFSVTIRRCGDTRVVHQQYGDPT